MGWAYLVVAKNGWVICPKMFGCSLFMFNFLVVGEGFAMRSAVMSKFVERSLVNEANEGKAKARTYAKVTLPAHPIVCSSFSNVL